MAKKIYIPDGWEVKKLWEVAEKVTKKNNINSDNVLTISAQYGLINQKTFFNKKIASNDTSGYYLINRNDFAYNKSYSANYPYGAFKKLNLYDNGVVSTLYICFRFITKNINLIFIEHYFEAQLFNRYIYSVAQEGARNHGLLNITNADFFNMPILLPPLAEQKKIAEILSLWDKAIQQTKELIAYKEKYKKGLMQNLLTGKKRLNGYTDKWKTYIIKELGQIITGKTPNTEKSEYYGNEYLFITPTDIHNKYTVKTERLLSENGLYKSKLIPKNSVLVTCIASIGKNTINKSDCAINQQINAIVPNNNYYYEYLYYYMTFNSPYLSKFAGKSATSIINKTTFEEIDITIPPLDEQKAIADILSSADKEIELLKKQLNLYTEQKKGLMQNLLTGKVRV